MKRTALRRTSRLRPASARRRADMVTRTAMLLGLKDAVGYRCEFCRDPKCQPLDGHEVRKPRSLYWLDPEFVVILGRKHHEMAEAAYGSTTGRLEIPGTRSTGWGFVVVHGANKWSVRAAAASAPPFCSPPLSTR